MQLRDYHLLTYQEGFEALKQQYELGYYQILSDIELKAINGDRRGVYHFELIAKDRRTDIKKVIQVKYWNIQQAHFRPDHYSHIKGQLQEKDLPKEIVV